MLMINLRSDITVPDKRKNANSLLSYNLVQLLRPAVDQITYNDLFNKIWLIYHS